jgi:PAS domain S-box-containing protein
MPSQNNKIHDKVDIALLEILDKIEEFATFVLDYPNGLVLYASPSCKAILGYDPNYYTENGADAMFQALHPEDVAKVNAHSAKYLNDMVLQYNTGNPKIVYYSFEFRLKHAKGHWIWIQVENLTNQFSSKGKPLEFVSIFKDISGQKAAENLLWDELINREPDEEKQKEIRNKYALLLNHKADSMPIPAHLIEITRQTNPKYRLSDREKEVLRWIAKGYSSSKIALELNISENTVESHRRNMMKRYGVTSSAELIKEANREYWLGN